jgi:hypothetical protein
VTGAGPPPAVRRYRERPLAWTLVLAAVFAVLFLGDLAQADREDAQRQRSVLVTGTVADYDGGFDIGVTYRHPDSGEAYEVDTFVSPDVAPKPGASIDLLVSRADPGSAVVAADRFDTTEGLFAHAPLLGLPVLFWLVRVRWVRRTRKLMASPAPSFAMLGSLRPPRRFGRRCELHLYSVDAEPGSTPVCVVPVLATGGVPVAAAAFPVEVKGVPRPLGHVVARAGDAVLWPGGRALLGTRSRLPSARTTVSPLARRPVRADALAMPSWWTMARPEAVIFVLGVALLLFAGAAVTTNRRGVERLLAEGIPTVGEVVRHEGDDDRLVMAYRLPGEQERHAHLTVEWASDYPIGRRYAIRVDRYNGARARLVQDPYDTVEPLGWAAAPAVVAGGLVLQRRRWWGRSRRAARAGVWHDVVAWKAPDNQVWTRIAAGPRHGEPSVVLRLPLGSPLPEELRSRRGVGAALAGDASPGSEAALLIGETVVLPAGPAVAPELGGEGRGWSVT